ncbi:MAG: DUF4292 domain-containing protein [Bacteroidota bacterium]
MIKQFYIITILCFVCFSCKTSHQENKKSETNLPSKSNIGEINKDSVSKNDRIWDLKPQNNSWYSSRISVEISTTTTDEISAYIVNKRDSIIYININKFGIELARAVLTPDSVIMVNRFEKTFYRGNYSIIKQLYGFSLTFDVIQSIILCEDFSNYPLGAYSEKSNDSIVLLSFPRRVDNQGLSAIHQEITVDKSRKKIIKNWLKDIQTQRIAIITYQNFEQLEGFVFPKAYTLELPGTSIKIEAKSTRVNTPGPTSLTIPQKYTPMFPTDGNR